LANQVTFTDFANLLHDYLSGEGLNNLNHGDWNVYQLRVKDRLSLKIKQLHIHLYFIATQYIYTTELGP